MKRFFLLCAKSFRFTLFIVLFNFVTVYTQTETTGQLSFKSDYHLRIAGASYSDTMQIIYNGEPLNGLSFKLRSNPTDLSSDNILILSGVEKGSDISSSDWNFSYELKIGDSSTISSDYFIVLIYGVDSTTLLTGTYNDLVRFTYSIIDTTGLDTLKSYFRLEEIESSLINGNSAEITGGIEQIINIIMIPSAPSNLIAIADTFYADLSWVDNSKNELGFKIERKLGDTTSAEPWVLIDSLFADQTTYRDTGLTSGITYLYRVYSYNEVGNSPYSNIVQTNTIIPVELTSFTANILKRKIILNWITAIESNNSGFDIERKTPFIGKDISWEKIGFVEGKGTTTEEHNYYFMDDFSNKSVRGQIYYRLKQIDYSGRFSYSKEINIEVDFTPKEYALYQNFPNPFNPSTTIEYSLPFESDVKLTIHNVLGEKITELVNTNQDVGYYEINWNAINIASGIYFYTIEAKSVTGEGNFNSVRKMVLLR